MDLIYTLGDITTVEKIEHEHLSVDWINNLKTADLITMSTNQVIESNVYVSEILATEVSSRVFNDFLHFANTVVILGNDTTIECKFRYFFI